jgi:hypothetical protein
LDAALPVVGELALRATAGQNLESKVSISKPHLLLYLLAKEEMATKNSPDMQGSVSRYTMSTCVFQEWIL